MMNSLHYLAKVAVVFLRVHILKDSKLFRLVDDEKLRLEMTGNTSRKEADVKSLERVSILPPAAGRLHSDLLQDHKLLWNFFNANHLFIKVHMVCGARLPAATCAFADVVVLVPL